MNAKHPLGDYVVDIREVRVFPTEGLLRIRLIYSSGKKKNIFFSIRKADLLGQKILQSVSSAEVSSNTYGKKWLIHNNEIALPIHRLQMNRTIPANASDGVIVQLVLEGVGLISFKLTKSEANALASSIRLSSFRLVELEEKKSQKISKEKQAKGEPIEAGPAIITTPLPNEFLYPLGQIAVLWGRYELEFTYMLEAMTNSTQTGHDWRFYYFDKKVKRFKVEMNNIFYGCSNILSYLSNILKIADELQIKRNILLHGTINTVWKDVPQKGDIERNLILVAKGRQKQKDYEFHFDLDALEGLFHELSAAAGRMAILGKDPSLVPGLSTSEIQLLRDFLHKYHPTQTNQPLS